MNMATYMVKNAFRNPRRTALTGISLAVSLALIVVLRTILLEITKPATLDEAIPRIVVRHRTSLTMSLPRPYEQKIRRVEGVKAVTVMNWFGGIWKDDKFENFFARFAVDPDEFFNVFIDLTLPDPQMLENFKATRNGAIVGRKLVERYGFQVGDTITIQGDIYPIDPEFKIVGVFDGPTPDFMVFQIKYLDEMLGETARAGTFFLLADDPSRIDSLTTGIQDMFRNSDAEVKAETEKSFQLSFVEMLGNIKLFINAIVSVVIFAVLMIAASTMSLAIRERTREVATLKAIGFTRESVLLLIVGEGLVISCVGGAVGLLASWLMLPSPRWFSAIFAGVGVAALLGLPALAASLFLPEIGVGYRGQLARIREFTIAVAPKASLLAGCFVTLLLLHTMPPYDWFSFSGGMIQSMNVREETLWLGGAITLVVGLGSSLLPAWQASRLSVLDGLRTLE